MKTKDKSTLAPLGYRAHCTEQAKQYTTTSMATMADKAARIISAHIPAWAVNLWHDMQSGDYEDPDGLVVMVDPYLRGSVALWAYAAGIPLDAYRAVLSAAWIQSHSSVVKAAGGRRTLRQMFAKAQWDTSALPDQLTIYRGTSGVSAAKAQRGLSWTTSLETAQWFADRFASISGPPLVLRAVVDRADVMMACDDRSESEIVTFSPRAVAQIA